MSEENAAQLLENETQSKEPSSYLAYCRIPGGIAVTVKTSSGDEKTIILKSATTQTEAPDGTITFNINPAAYGITTLTRSEKNQIEAQLKTTRLYTHGFVFFAASKESGDRKAAEYLKKIPETGMEPLDGAALAMASDRNN